MARPRKDEKIKAIGRKGTGTISKGKQKILRKKRKSKMCKICSECKDRSLCNNREGSDKCDKCKECLDKNCDRFYIYTPIVALSPQKNGTRNYIGRYDKQSEAQISIDKAKNGGFTKKSDVTLFQVLEKVNNKKLEINKIKENTDSRNLAVRKKMNKYNLGTMKIQDITTVDLQKYLSSLAEKYSQSDIDKHKNEIKTAFNYAVKNKLITENPVDDLDYVASKLPIKIARPFELDEQNLLLEYIDTSSNLTDSRSTMDSITIKNIIKLAFATGQRIGELLALRYDKSDNDIFFDKEMFIISKTITKDKNGRFVLGNCTKNSKKRLKKGLPDYREIPFNIASSSTIKNILQEQLEHSKAFSKNANHFLFCNSEGNFIIHPQVTVTFKRICRELHIQEDNAKGCHIHQARHSFVTRCLEARYES